MLRCCCCLCPLVGDTLLRTLETEPPITAAGLARAQAIVVLGGGSYPSAPEYGGDTVSGATLERLRYAARLQRASGLPVLVTGGAPFGGRPEGVAMAQSLTEDFGVPVRWVESASRDTAENAAMSAALLKAAGVSRIALVSHSWHLPRAIELFERQGLAVIAAPTVFKSNPSPDVQSLLPSVGALDDSYVALHEWLGRLVQALHR